MRQVMPHRNNMSLHRNKCKIFLRRRGAIVRRRDDFATDRSDNMIGTEKYLHAKQWFTCIPIPRRRATSNMLEWLICTARNAISIVLELSA